MAVTLQHYPCVLALVSEPSGARDIVKHALARGLGRKAARYHRCIYLADDADERGILGRQRHHHLRLDCPILDAIDNDLLDLRGRLTGGRNQPCIWNGNHALGINGLIWQRDEVARPHARLGGYEQAASGCFEDRNADYVADTKADFWWWTMVTEDSSEGTRTVLF